MFDNAAIFKEDNLLGRTSRKVHFMGHNQHSNAFTCELFDYDLHFSERASSVVSMVF